MNNLHIPRVQLARRLGVSVLRPLSTGELLDRTFYLYRNHLPVFVGISALPQLGVFALRLVDSAFWLPLLIASRTSRILLFFFVSFIALEISHAATVVAVSHWHLGGMAGIGVAYAQARTSLFRVVGIASTAFVLPLLLSLFLSALALAGAVGILAGTGVFRRVDIAIWIRALPLGLVLLAAPFGALRWWLAWSLVVPVTVLEGTGLRASMRRSRWLTRGVGKRVLLIYVLVAFLGWGATHLFQAPFYAMVPWQGFLPVVHASRLAWSVSAAGHFISTSLLGPLLSIAFTLIYYDQRVRREGFDMELMISTLGGAGPIGASAAPAS